MLLSASKIPRLFTTLLAISFLLNTQGGLCVMRHYQPLARSQRQTTANEPAFGLTGTGTNFNSIYGDPFYTQQQTIYQIDDSDYPGVSHYPGLRNPVPTLQTNHKLGTSSYSSYGSYGGGGLQGWRGFGASKDGSFKGPGQSPSYGGVKY